VKLSCLQAETIKQISLDREQMWLAPLLSELGNIKNYSGAMQVNHDAAGFFYIKGQLDVTYDIACRECATVCAKFLSIPIQGTFRPSFHGVAPTDIQLSFDDLDVYFIDADDALDLGQLVFDSLQLELPSPFDQDAELNHLCSNCREHRTNHDTNLGLGFNPRPSSGDTGHEAESPLATKLKNLLQRS
jgi:uncharacterized metal-binding protein YceD (DUF177 family)